MATSTATSSMPASAATSSVELNTFGARNARGDIEGENQHIIEDDNDGNDGDNDAHANEREIGALAPADGGKAAWGFLSASLIVETLCWGLIFSFGTFQSYFENVAFKGQGSFASVGTSSSGVLYLAPPVVFPLFLAWPSIRRWATVAGLSIMCISLIGASFATSKDALILTQGLLYSVGGALVYCPAILFLDEWFVRRKGTAFGIMWAGTGLGGIILPVCINAGLNAYGFRTVLRFYAVVMACLMGPVLPFIRPRLPPSPTYNFNLKFLVSPLFILLQTGNILEALGYFLPSIYLPTYASMLGASATVSTLTVVAVNASTVVGSIGMGFLVDRYPVHHCIFVSSVGTAFGVFLIWGMSSSLPPLFIFCCWYGLFAGSYTVCWTGIMRLVSTKIARVNPLMVFSFLATGRGIGNVISGPLSSVLVTSSTWSSDAISAYQSKYLPLIIFVGSTAILGGISSLGRFKPGLLTT